MVVALQQPDIELVELLFLTQRDERRDPMEVLARIPDAVVVGRGDGEPPSRLLARTTGITWSVLSVQRHGGSALAATVELSVRRAWLRVILHNN
jgi:hypothetical protein